MRTEIHLEGDLLTEAERFAIARGATLQALVEEALRLLLRERSMRPSKPTEELPTWGSGWLRPGVDLDHTATLLDLMDQDDAPV
ncbi:MAG: type II toxin-antitoxin system VapB family antitoxin [Acidobacteriota bacterium]